MPDKYRPIVRETTEEPQKPATVAELRATADALGIDHTGMKKADLEAAIAAKHEEPPAQPATDEESA